MLDDYITIDDLADYMEVDELTTENALVAIWGAQETVRAYLDQDITSNVSVETRDGQNKQVMRLRQRPVRRVDYVTIDDVQLSSDSWKLRGARIALPDGYFSYGLDNVAVQYLHGYDLTSHGSDYSIPADIRLVTLSVARRAYMFRGEQTGTIQTEQIGKYSYTNKTGRYDPGQATQDVDLLASEKHVLDQYLISVVI
jgi:hypothetical protein